MKIILYGEQTATTSTPDSFGYLNNFQIDEYALSKTRGADDSKLVELHNIGDEELVALTYDDDSVWYAQVGELRELMPEGLFRSPGEDESDGTLVIQPFIRKISTERGILGEIGLKLIGFFAPGLKKKASEVGAHAIAKMVENKIADVGEGLFNVGVDFIPVPVTSEFGKDGPVLLMIHGFGVNCKKSFGSLSDDDAHEWKAIIKQYRGQNVYIFDHFSFSKSPLENLLLLVQLMPRREVRLHLLTQSRGGLVGELLCLCTQTNGFMDDGTDFLDRLRKEKFLQFQKLHPDWSEEKINLELGVDEGAILRKIKLELVEKKVIIEKYVRVACPAAGTNILCYRSDVLLNNILNLIRMVTGTGGSAWADAIQELLLAVAAQKNNAAVLPGLAAMMTDSPTVQLINRLKPEQIVPNHSLHVIACKAVGGLGVKAFAWLAEKVFPGENDLVVDTNSMFLGAQRSLTSYYYFVKTGKIHHLNYFKHPEVKKAIALQLGAEVQNPPEFKEIGADPASNRGGVLGLWNGSYPEPEKPLTITGQKPVVVLLPGIMGSNLSLPDVSSPSKMVEIWLAYNKIMGGGLYEIGIDVQKIVPTSVIGDAYAEFAKFLLNKGFDVMVFPYDWRLSLEDLGRKFNDFMLNEIIPKAKDQSIKIVAHSMGGLVVRDLMVNYMETWIKLKQRDASFRFIMLGTPWRGSYLIPKIISGRGKTINSLSLLDANHSKRELLSKFVQYPGLIDLLPYYGHEFEDINLWLLMNKKETEFWGYSTWIPPSDNELKRFVKYRDKMLAAEATMNFERVIYVAGKSDSTAADMRFKSLFGKAIDKKTVNAINAEFKDSHYYRLSFYETNQGDGSVTWESGIPFPLDKRNGKLFYVNTEHGELACDVKNFEGYLQLINSGTTHLLSNAAIRSSETSELKEMPPYEHVIQEKEELMRSIVGLRSRPLYQSTAISMEPPLKVRVMNGDLKNATYPIMVGHFKGDGIMSAEAVLDELMKKELSKRVKRNRYPGEISESLILLPMTSNDLGAIIVGLGQPESLTPFRLSKTIEDGITEYLLSQRHQLSSNDSFNSGITSLLIGTSYANMTLSTALAALLEGVSKANRIMREDFGENANCPQILELEILEMYRDKSEYTYFLLNEFSTENRGFNIIMERPIYEGNGIRIEQDFMEDREWWTRISASEKIEMGERSIIISASNGRARVDQRNLMVNPDIIDGLLEENSRQSDWNLPLARTLFELLVPNDFKIAFRNQQNILWILDDSTARYPVELLHYDSNANVPVGTRAGMIRQLSTPFSPPILNPVNNLKALVIGDPLLAEGQGVRQLAAAEQEAIQVANQLSSFGYTINSIIKGSYTDVLNNLFDEYRIIHIASHGVLKYGPNKRTGILLSNGKKNIVLTPAEIHQISNTAELVFINCCHMGKVDKELEEHFQYRHQLAANIGTEFIKKGVKAVVVAGWAVNDAAAKYFAEKFYEGMLKGQTFGNAVRQARKSCFDDYPGTNTWGAYQCYGDPFYTLKTNGGNDTKKTEFVIGKEALIALENWSNKACSNQANHAELKSALEEISRRIERSTLNRIDEILEKEAIAYAELGDTETAKKKLTALFGSERMVYTTRAASRFVELNSRNLKPQSLSTNKRDVSQPSQAYADLFESIFLVEKNYIRLCRFGESEKIKAWRLENFSKFKTAIDYFNNALKLKENAEPSEKANAWLNMLLLECLRLKTTEGWKNWKDSYIAKNQSRLFDDIIQTIVSQLTTTLVKQKTKQSFFNLLLALECQLLFKINQEDHSKIIATINSIYTRFMTIHGSQRVRLEKVNQIQFVLYFIGQNRNDLALFKESMQELLDVYRSYIKS